MASSIPENGVHSPSQQKFVKPLFGEEVVISGISGIFPKSNNTREFSENLFKNVNMVSDVDMNFHNPEAPRHIGQINGLTKFDAQFFRVAYHHATTMEPVSRKLLEQAYMAIYDAGINPLALKGKKVGVFIGTSYSDTSNVAMYHSTRQKGFILSGCGKSMFSNRISYWIDAKGPSYSLDCSCASSMVCLEHAYQAMTKGECEAAIVGGGNICKLPQLGLNLRKAGMACIDGKTKCFDMHGDGPVRAEAINCIFLQKAKDAKRIYAEVYYAQVMYGLKEDAHFLPTRKPNDIIDFLNSFYSDIDVLPTEVEYVEADGSAIAEADAAELVAIGNVFVKDRKKNVKIGSVKSNMGHAEPASGVCAITKVCLAYHKGNLPANLHLTEPIHVAQLVDGRMKLLQKNEPFNRGYTAVNQFSYNGTNCHVLLKGHHKAKDTSKYISSIPRIVLVSGRQDECVKYIFNTLEGQTIDPEVIGMLHNIYQLDTPGHTSRGYSILNTNEENKTLCLSQSIEHYTGSKRPLCLVFSGMGSQWPGMAADLMKIPTFAATIHKCHMTLEPFGVDLIRVLVEPDKTIFDNILHCFIGISAVQIALTDVLKKIGVDPDYIIGHSQGEMCCAYWDECFTTEEVILAAYSRGVVSLESEFSKGAMAAVGLGYKEISNICPPEIDVACHNSNESATLSGPNDILDKFVAQLQAKNIFARQVPSGNIAFHSRYIRHAGPEFLKKLQAIIKEPKLRSKKWICTSIPKEGWHEDIAKYSSAEFHANNLMSPVYFEEGAQLIPTNAVIVEVAPHGLLQAILKRSHPECSHIPLTKRGHDNPVYFFLESIGKLYQEGYNFKIDSLYPQIQYPVATETEMISHLVNWEHSEHWPELVSYTKNVVTASSREFIMSIHDDEFKYMAGYIRDGNNVFPESAIIFLVWETLAIYKGVNYKDMSVVFRDIHFHREAIIFVEEPLKLNFMINRGNNYFEVTRNEVLLANGYVAEIKKPKFELLEEDRENSEYCDSWEEDIRLTSEDIYKHLYAKGLTYRYDFRSIISTNFNRTTAQIKRNDNFIILLDSLIQLNILATDIEDIIVPKMINKLTISADDYNKDVMLEKDCYNAKLYNCFEVSRCNGIEIKQIIFDTKPIIQRESDVLDCLVFVPHSVAEEVSIRAALQVNLQIVADNILDEVVTVTEVTNGINQSISEDIEEVANYIPNLHVTINTVEHKYIEESVDDSNLVILLNLFQNGTNINEILKNINEDAFILTYSQKDLNIENYYLVSKFSVQERNLILFRKIKASEDKNTTYLSIKNDDRFTWVPTLEYELLKVNRVVLISERQPHCGLFGFIKSLRKQYPKKIYLVIVNDYNATAFDKNNPVFKEQLEKCLCFNVLQKGHWGSYYYLQNQPTNIIQNIKLINVHCDNDSLKWIETPKMKPCNELVQVCFAGPSISDSQKVTNEENGIGCDFSGLDSNGDRVMGLISCGAIASTVRADPYLLWQVPNYWSLEDAATVPLPYVIAFYCLAIKGQLLKGQSVFVNEGAGAFGQAVISVCLSLDCTVYASVSDLQKKQFLIKLFPKLEGKNISFSKNNDYAMVKTNTKGRGCDFVLNSASGCLREDAMKCVRPWGIFIDINELDWTKNTPFGMSYITNDRTYMSVRLSSILRVENLKERKIIQRIIAEGIKNGTVRPLTRIVYPTTEVSRAFRLLKFNNHRGRVLFKMRNAEISNNSLNVIPRIKYSANGTYAVICDETELGYELANRLVKRGARRILLHLKYERVPGFVHLKFASWMKLGTQIKISTVKLDSDKGCAQFLNEASTLGDVHGIFIIQESTVEDNGWSQKDFLRKNKMFITVLAKLDVLSKNNYPYLRNFVVISRSSKNAVAEYTTSMSHRICEDRLKVGLSSVAFKIQLLDEDDDNRFYPNNSAILNALETSLAQKHSSAIIFNATMENSKCLGNVMKLLASKNLNDIDSRLTINDLISSDNMMIEEELKTLIKDSCKIEYTLEKLKLLPITSLKTLLKICLNKNNKFNSKLGAFYTFVDKDEYMATNAMVPMETIISKNVETNELDETKTHLLLIPGFEGHNFIFKTVCERLKVRAVTYQLGPDIITKSISEMASNILKLIRRTIVFKSKFYLLGYSFGVNVALEVAALLEKEGYIGVVLCLDSSPDALRVQLDAHIGDITDSQLQNSIIEHFYQLMSGQKCSEMSKTIEILDDWSEKIDIFTNMLRRYSVSYSKEYMQNVLDSAYKRIQLAKNYKPCFQLKSELVLLKGIPHPKSENLAFDYGLSKYTKNPVIVINIPSDHASAPQDCRISNIVNKFIDPVLLEDKANLCNTYKIE